MIPLNNVASGYWSWLNADATLRSICGDAGRIIKGEKRPDGLPLSNITVSCSERTHTGDFASGNQLLKVSVAPTLIACFAPLNENSSIPYPQLSTMAARVHTLAATSRPTITGGTVHRLGAYSESGPAWDGNDPDEAYIVISLGFHVQDNA
jgi:hypothetical protein